MRAFFGLLICTVVICLVGSYARLHWLRTVAPAVAEQTSDTTETSTPSKTVEQGNSHKAVILAGPLADYVSRQYSEKIEGIQPTGHQPVASDYVTDSPVGTSRVLLHKTFALATASDLPFALPAHAASAKLRGTYRSYLQGDAPDDDDAAVEFLLLNEQQYADLLKGRPANASFAAEGAAEQQVDFSFPPSFDQPVKYHLLFRNNAPKTGKKLVRADFRIEF